MSDRSTNNPKSKQAIKNANRRPRGRLLLFARPIQLINVAYLITNDNATMMIEKTAARAKLLRTSERT